MIVMVTGAAGFSGSHMISLLTSVLSDTDNLYGIIHINKQYNFIHGCTYIQCDLTDIKETEDLFKLIIPDVIINLAGVTHGSLSGLFSGNVIITKNILESAIHLEKKPRILIIGSSAEYGYAGDEPISEDKPVNPVSEYGIVKAASTFLALQYYSANNLPIVIIRPFNLIGPGQSVNFACGYIIHQFLHRNGSKNIISVKNLDSERDFLDIRDAVIAYWKIISHNDFSGLCAGKIFNIGSGVPHNTQDIIDIIASLIPEHTGVTIHSANVPDRIPVQRSDNCLLSSVIKWHPVIPLEKSLEDMIDSMRKGI